MTHPRPDHTHYYFARVTIPCREHGGHRAFLASVDDMAHILADDIAAHHERAGMYVEVQKFTLPRGIGDDLFTAVAENSDDLPY